MPTIQRIRRTASRLLLTLTALTALFLSSFAPLVSADATTAYTAGQIQAWLEGMISGTEITVERTPSVALKPDTHLLQITDLSFKVRGVTIGLSELKITFNGSTKVGVTGELDVFGKNPRFKCTAVVECFSEGKLHLKSLSDIVIIDAYTPGLSPEDLKAIVNVLNQVLDASGLSVTSPGGELNGLDVAAEGGLQATWSGSDTTYYAADSLRDALANMAETLADKATSYLKHKDEWEVTVAIPTSPGDELQIGASFPAFGVTAELSQCNITFETLTASVTDALFSIGTATKEATFSLDAEIGCTNQTPSLTITSLTATGEHSGFNGFISDIAPALLDAMNDAAAAIIADIELLCPYSSISAITVEDNAVVLHEGAYLVEGDVTLDGRVSVADAVAILQYTVGIRSLDANQLKAGDTTDDDRVSVADAVHILQFTIDPYGIHNILARPLWQSPADDGMIDPLELL